MDKALKQALYACETDVEGAVERLLNSEELYISCLFLFLKDPTFVDLERAVAKGDWDASFTAAHALKGLAGNMGFIPMFHASAELVLHIRAGRQKEIAADLATLKRCREQIVHVILTNCPEWNRAEYKKPETKA